MAAAAQQVMLAQKWSDKVDPTGWWMSEKLDGVRAYWSGSNFYSRQGNQFIAPAWFTKDLPKEPLDGELWCGRGLFQKTLSIIKKTKDPEKYADDWKYVTYLVFDAPGRSDAGEKYEQRVKWMENNIEPKRETTYASVVGVCKCTGMPHLQKMLKQVLVKGGEGIMLRKPSSLYEHCRSHTLLKVKFFHDEEAKVVGKENGSGRCQNMMGKLHCVLPNGVQFKVGSGFSDAQRRNPPKIGTIISFKYQEMSDQGHPRFPVFLRERTDMSWKDVLENAKTKAPFSSLKKKTLVPQLKKQHSILFSTIPSRDADTGKKVVTSNDTDDVAEDEADNLLTKKTAMLPPASPVVTGKKRGATGKRMCQYGAMCYQKNKDHLDKFDHPEAEEDADDDAPAAADDEEEKPKKRAKTDAASSPSSASASPPTVPASSPKKASRACHWGEDCYNKDPDHLRRFTHPEKKEPETVEQFILTTNQSQANLSDYYNFGGDEPEEEVEAILAEDRNERDMQLQKFNDQRAKELGVSMDEDEDEEDADAEEEEKEGGAAAGGAADHDLRTVILPVKKASYFQDCASDDDDENDHTTVLMKDLPSVKREKSGAKSALQRVNSNDPTVVVPRVTRASSRGNAAGIMKSGGGGNSSASSAIVAPLLAVLPNGKPCPFLLPELLGKAALTFENESGDVCCKKCKVEAGEHREHR